MSSALANKIVVGKDKAISTLRQGIKTAKDGDTILLNKGIYKEGNIIINKAIYLIGLTVLCWMVRIKMKSLRLPGKIS
jgi:hypothetical protein